MIKLVEAGRAYKVFGIKGELLIDLHPSYAKHILESKVIFFKVDGNAIPFFIESTRGSDELYVRFKDVTTPEQARELSNQALYVDASRMKVIPEPDIEEEDDDELHALINFEIIDVNTGVSGIIKDLEEFPSQLMALVVIGNKECMVPIHDDFIVEIDEKNRKIKLDLPEGLLEI